MNDDSKRIPKWRSISEGNESLPLRPTTRRSAVPKPPSVDEMRRKKKLLLINAGLISAAVLLLAVLVLSRGGSEPASPRESVVESAPASKPKDRKSTRLNSSHVS